MKNQLKSVMHYEFKKRFDLPYLEVIMFLVIFKMIRGIKTTYGSSTSSLPWSSSLLERFTTRALDISKIPFLEYNNDFIFLIVTTSFVVSYSFGYELENQIFKTQLLQTQCTRKIFFIGKVALDWIILLVLLLFSFFILAVFSPYHFPFAIGIASIAYYFSKLFFFYSCALLVSITLKQILIPLIVPVGTWYFLQYLIPIIFTEKPWSLILSIDSLKYEAVSTLVGNLLLFSFTFIVVGILLFSLSYQIFKNMELI